MVEHVRTRGRWWRLWPWGLIAVLGAAAWLLFGGAAALRQAQAFVRSQEKWKHPHYWAAWVLWGLP